ncbi:MAG: B12-binding domain-containing radical SAM protein [Planctomycetota bacterium]|jgi:radical SAM superfamily enzyme YgiQ (UPF0313 family)
MKILLINASGCYTHEYPPLGLLYIASVLRDAGHEIGFFDEGAKSKTGLSLLDYTAKFKPDACGIAAYTTNISETFKKISLIKKQIHECIMIIGGPHATVLPERTLDECEDIDYLVCGEGENTTKELLDTLQNNGDVLSVDGLYLRANDKIQKTPPRELIKDLDSIPFPMYELIDNFQYVFDSLKVGEKLATLMTSRGCPYDCTFCAAKAVWRGSFRRRSPENVVQEIKLLVDRYGYNELYFMDDLFAVNKRWLDNFYILKQENSINVPWKCLGRVDLLAYEDYEEMADSGCYLIQFGVESGDNEILEDINKKITTLQITEAFSQARLAGLNTYAFFIIGHRLDTYETILKTIYFAKKLCPDFLSFFCLVPFPGTKLYDLIPGESKYDWSRLMYSDWGRNLPPIQISSVDSKDLLAFEQQAYAKVYLSMSYVLKNIIFSKSHKRLLRIKCKVMIQHFLSMLFHICKGTWIFSRFKGMSN